MSRPLAIEGSTRAKANGEWDAACAVLRYAALLIGATLSAAHGQFIRYNKHFASCSAATGTRNGQHGQSDC